MNISYGSQPANFIKKLKDFSLKEKIVKRIKSLSEEPYPRDVKKVKDRADKIFRIRINDYRVVYRIRSEEDRILILMIENRSNAYKKK